MSPTAAEAVEPTRNAELRQPRNELDKNLRDIVFIVVRGGIVYCLTMGHT